MLVLMDVKFAEKGNMYLQTKHSLINFLGVITEEKVRMGPNVRLEPGWKKSASSSYRHRCDQHYKIGWMTKKLNPLGSD